MCSPFECPGHGKESRMKKTKIFFIIYMCFWLAENSLSPYLGLYYESRGLSGTQIGVINSVFSVAVILSALAIGVIGDKLQNSRTILLLLCAGMILGVASLAAGAGYIQILGAIVLYGCAYSPFNGIVDKALMGQLKGEEEKFGRYRMGGTIGAGIGVLIAGILLKYYTFKSIFLTYCITMLVCSLFSAKLPVFGIKPAESATYRDYIMVIRHKNFLSIYIPMVIWGITESGVMQFQALHVARCGYSSSYTSLFIASAMVGECLMFGVIPKILKKLGKRKAVVLAYILQFGRAGALALLGVLPLPVVVLLQMTGGGAYAALYSTITQMIGETFPEKIAYTAHNLKLVVTRGIGTTIGSMFLGILYDKGMTVPAYGTLAVTAALYAAGMFLKKEELC